MSPLLILLVALCAGRVGGGGNHHNAAFLSLEKGDVKLPAAGSQDLSPHIEWRMEATAHIGSLCIRSMYCKLEPDRPCDLPEKVKIGPLKEWASKDYGWERILSSLSLYELARRFWQQQDYERSLVAVEQSIALKLFPYTDMKLLTRWQQSLVTPGYLFKRPKLELADALILKANCMYELGRREQSVEYLYQALEAIHLSAAMMHSSMDLVQEVLAHLETLSQHVGATAADTLQRMKTTKLLDLMGRYGIQCHGCKDKSELLSELVYRLALPVRFSSGGSRLEATDQPFIHQAYARQPYEGKREFMQRFFAQLVGMVHSRFLKDMRVYCSHADSDTGACLSHLPLWTYSNSEEFEHLWALGPDNSTSSSGDLPSAAAAVAAVSGEACEGSAEAGSKAGAGSHSCSSGLGNATERAGKHLQPPGRLPDPDAAPRVPTRQLHVPVGQDAQSGASAGPGGGYTLLEKDRVRAYAVKDMNALIDKFVTSDRSGEMLSLMQTLDYLTSLSSSSGAASASASATPSAADSRSRSAHAHGSATGSQGRGPAAATAAGRAGGVSEYTKKLQACLSAPSQHPSACAEILEQFDVLAIPPFPPPPVTFSPKLGPLAPLPFKPPLPAPDKCCPVYRRRLNQSTTAAGSSSGGGKGSRAEEGAGRSGKGQAQGSAGQAAGAGTGAGAAQQPSASGPAQQQGPYQGPAMEDPRQLSDRQLQEQLRRLAQESPYRRDDPAVILTLSGVTLALLLSVTISKHRRRISRYLAGRGPLFSFGPAAAGSSAYGSRLGGGAGAILPGSPFPGILPAAAGSADAAGAALAGQVGALGVAAAGGVAGAVLSTPFVLPSHQRRALAAALRDALAGPDVAKLESAVLAAEAAGLDPALLTKARSTLAQRRKKEKEREHMKQQAAKAKAKEAAKRAGRSEAREAHSGGGSAGPGSVGGGAGAGAGSSRASSRGPSRPGHGDPCTAGSDDGHYEADNNGGGFVQRSSSSSNNRSSSSWLAMLWGSFRSRSGRSLHSGSIACDTAPPLDVRGGAGGHEQLLRGGTPVGSAGPSEVFDPAAPGEPLSSADLPDVRASVDMLTSDQRAAKSSRKGGAAAGKGAPDSSASSLGPWPCSGATVGLDAVAAPTPSSSTITTATSAAGSASATATSGGSAAVTRRKGSNNSTGSNASTVASSITASTPASTLVEHNSVTSDTEEGWQQQTSKPRRKPASHKEPQPPPPAPTPPAPKPGSSSLAQSASSALAAILNGTSNLHPGVNGSIGSHHLGSSSKYGKGSGPGSIGSASSAANQQLSSLSATRVSAAEYASMFSGNAGATGAAAPGSAAHASASASATSTADPVVVAPATATGASKGWLDWLSGGSKSAAVAAPAPPAAAAVAKPPSAAAPGKRASATVPAGTAAGGPRSREGRPGGWAEAAAAGLASSAAAPAGPASSAAAAAHPDAFLLNRASPIKTKGMPPKPPASSASSSTPHTQGIVASAKAASSQPPSRGGLPSSQPPSAGSTAGSARAAHGGGLFSLPPPPSQPAAPSAASSFMGALSSLIGYGSSGSPTASPHAAQGMTYSAANASVTDLPSTATSARSAAAPSIYDSIDQLLPASIMPDPVPPRKPFSSRPLNPAAPSFRTSASGGHSASRAAAAAAAAGASPQPSGAVGHGANGTAAGPSASLFSSLGSPGGSHSASHAHNPLATHTTAGSLSSAVTSPTSPAGSAYSGLHGFGGGAGAAAAPGAANPFQSSAAAAAAAAAAVASGGAAPMPRLRIGNLGSGLSLNSSAVASVATGVLEGLGLNEPLLVRRSITEGLYGAAHASAAPATTAPPSAVSNFNMFSGSSVWSPSAVAREGGSDGWNTAPSAAAAVAAAVHGSAGGSAGAASIATSLWGAPLGLPALGMGHTTSSFTAAPTSMLPLADGSAAAAGSGGSTGAAAGAASAGGSLCSEDSRPTGLGLAGVAGAGGVLEELPGDDLQEEMQLGNNWAQDIMRSVVD